MNIKNSSVYNNQNLHSLIIPDVPNEYFLDTDQFDSIYISQRYLLFAINNIKKGLDVSLTLYDNDETKNILSILKKIYPDLIDRLNIIFIPEYFYNITEYLTGLNVDWIKYKNSHGKNLELIFDEISIDTKKNIINLLNSDISKVDIKSYKVTPGILTIEKYINSLKEKLDVEILGLSDSKSNLVQQGKSILHSDLNGNFIKNFSSDIIDHIPKGFLVRESDGKKGIKIAIEKLKNYGINSFLIKPVVASSGEGIIFLDNFNLDSLVDNYDFIFGDIIIEECLDLLKLSELGIEKFGDDPFSLSVQYFDGKIIGNPLLQITSNNVFQGGITINEANLKKMGLDSDILSRVKSYSEKLIDELNLTGNGGFDYLFDKNGNFYFIDPNLGRDTGALPIRLFEEINKDILEDKSTIFTKIDSTNIFDLDIYFKSLKNEGINLFDINLGIGIIPVSFIKGQHLTLIISGNTFEEVEKMLQKVKIISSSDIFGNIDYKNREVKIGEKLIPYNYIHNN